MSLKTNKCSHGLNNTRLKNKGKQGRKHIITRHGEMSLKLVWGGWRMSNDMVVLKYGRGRSRENTSFDNKRIANRFRVVTRKRITFDKKPLSLIIIMIKSRLPWRQYQTWSCPRHSLSLSISKQRDTSGSNEGEATKGIFFIIFIRKNLIIPHNMWAYSFPHVG